MFIDNSLKLNYFSNMVKYEINVLTRKGRWKKLSQDLDNGNNDLSENNSNRINYDLKENLRDLVLDDKKIKSERNLDDNFTDLNKIIDDLKLIENQKTTLIEKLIHLEEDFKNKKNDVALKIETTKKEFDIYDQAIKIINAIKDN